MASDCKLSTMALSHGCGDLPAAPQGIPGADPESPPAHHARARCSPCSLPHLCDGQALGFFVVQFDDSSQPIRELEFVESRFVDEIRDELGYDLVLTDGSGFERVYRAFRYTSQKMPRTPHNAGQGWALHSHPISKFFVTVA